MRGQASAGESAKRRHAAMQRHGQEGREQGAAATAVVEPPLFFDSSLEKRVAQPLAWLDVVLKRSAMASGNVLSYAVTVCCCLGNALSEPVHRCSAEQAPCARAQAHKPTTVTHSVVGHFTKLDELNLIVACAPARLVHTHAPP